MTYADGKTLTVQGATFNLSEITGMEVMAEEFDDNTVLVEYNETAATITIAGNIAQYVKAEFNGAHVTIDQSADVSDSTCGEITYILTRLERRPLYSRRPRYGLRRIRSRMWP